ncbi:MAG: hypothetical protein IT262_09070 [Saprospiraceae bacterium]|jgi:hypothetical protein|nr:hypothetical protein [Saprospiraceae bacterium]
MLERCSGMVNSQELPEQRSGVQKMSSSVQKMSARKHFSTVVKENSEVRQ